MPILKRSVAELLGTFWLVFGGCGSAVLAAKFPEVGIGLVGVSLAFGLTVVTMAYAVGPITGGHFNPAVTLGLLAGGRAKSGDVVPYIIAQVIGAILAAWVLATIASGNGTDAVAGGLASNGFADHSPGGYSMATAFITEVLMTFFFLLIILGTTRCARERQLRAARHRPRAHADPSHQHSHHQHVRESRAQHGARAHRRWLGDAAAVAVLGRADSRRRGRRRVLALAEIGGSPLFREWGCPLRNLSQLRVFQPNPEATAAVRPR